MTVARFLPGACLGPGHAGPGCRQPPLQGNGSPVCVPVDSPKGGRDVKRCPAFSPAVFRSGPLREGAPPGRDMPEEHGERTATEGPQADFACCPVRNRTAGSASVSREPSWTTRRNVGISSAIMAKIFRSEDGAAASLRHRHRALSLLGQMPCFDSGAEIVRTRANGQGSL